MTTFIDLGLELLIDTSVVRDPYVRLLLAAIGRRLAHGSAWLVIDKQLATSSGLVLHGRERSARQIDWRCDAAKLATTNVRRDLQRASTLHAQVCT